MPAARTARNEWKNRRMRVECSGQWPHRESVFPCDRDEAVSMNRRARLPALGADRPGAARSAASEAIRGLGHDRVRSDAAPAASGEPGGYHRPKPGAGAPWRGAIQGRLTGGAGRWLADQIASPRLAQNSPAPTMRTPRARRLGRVTTGTSSPSEPSGRSAARKVLQQLEQRTYLPRCAWGTWSGREQPLQAMNPAMHPPRKLPLLLYRGHRFGEDGAMALSTLLSGPDNDERPLPLRARK